MSLLTFNFYLLILPVSVYAQADEIGQAQITPASPLYFLKSAREVLELKFAGSSKVQAIRQLEFATRRLREVNSLINTPHEELIEPTLVMYLSHLQELMSKAYLGDQTLASQIAQVTSLQMNILQTAYNQVTNPRAKRSIRTTIYSLSQREIKLIAKLESAKATSLVPQLVKSHNDSCNFIAKEASSAALNQPEKVIWLQRGELCFKDINTLTSKTGN